MMGNTNLQAATCATAAIVFAPAKTSRSSFPELKPWSRATLNMLETGPTLSCVGTLSPKPRPNSLAVSQSASLLSSPRNRPSVQMTGSSRDKQ